MATVVAEWGLPLIATRLIAGGGLEARSVLAALLGLRLALGFLAGLSVVALSFAASDTGAVHLGAAIAGLSFLPLAWLGSAQIQAQLDLRLERTAWAALGGGIAGLAWTLGALAADAGVPTLAAGLLVNAVAAALVGVALTPRGLPLWPRVERALWRRLLREATPLALSSACVAVYFYVDIALLARLSTSSQVGLYDAAYRFMLLGILLPSAVVTSVYALGRRAGGDSPRAVRGAGARAAVAQRAAAAAAGDRAVRGPGGRAAAALRRRVRGRGARAALAGRGDRADDRLRRGRAAADRGGAGARDAADQRRRRGVQRGREPRADPVAGRRGRRDRDAGDRGGGAGAGAVAARGARRGRLRRAAARAGGRGGGRRAGGGAGARRRRAERVRGRRGLPAAAGC